MTGRTLHRYRPHGLIRSTFLRNWLALLGADMASQALSFLSMFRVARHLAPEGYGVYTLALSTAGLAGLLAALGLAPVLVTQVAKRPEATRAVFLPALRIRAITVPMAMALVLLYYAYARGEASLTLITLTLVLLVAAGVVDLAESLAFGRQVMRYASALTLGHAVVWVAGLYAIPEARLTVTSILAYYAALQVAHALLFYALLWRDGYFRPAPDAPPFRARALLSRSWPFFWTGAVGQMSTQAPVLLLAAWSGSVEVGLYNAGNRLVAPMLLVLAGLARAMLPHLVATRSRSEQDYRRGVNDILSLVSVFGGVLGIVLTAAAPEAIVLVLGEAYRPAVPAFINQVWTMYLYAVMIVLGIATSAREEQRTLAWLSTAGAVVALGFVLAGAGHGAVVLSACLLGSYAVNAMLNIWVLMKRLHAGRARPVLRQMVTILAIAAAARLIPVEGAWWLRGAVAAALIVALAPWFRSELRLLRGAWLPAGQESQP